MDVTDAGLWILERILSYMGQGEPIKNYREGRKKKAINSGFFNEISNFYQERLSESCLPVVSDQSLTRSEAYTLWITKQSFQEISPAKRNVLILLALCNEYNSSKTAEVYSAIRAYVETFDISFSILSADVKMLLSTYYRAFHQTEKVSVNTFFSETNMEYQQILKEFSDKYSKDLVLRFVMGELSQSEELRNTLVELIRDGRLATFGLNQKTLSLLEAELRAKSNYVKTFVLLANKLPDSIANYIRQQPGFNGSSLNIRNIPDHTSKHRFSVWLFRPSEGFRNSQELLGKFKQLAKGSDEEFMVSILPIDGINSTYYTFPANQSFKNKMLLEAYELSSYFKTGSKYSDADIWNILVKSEIGISDILALIPFNILVPGIYPSEKEFIITNYPKLQENLGVKTITDWAEKDPKLIETNINGIGQINYTPAEKSAIGTQNRLEHISREIVENSRKLKSSLGLLQPTSVSTDNNS